MANERTHMNSQAGSRWRQATAVRGKTEIGSQPIQREPSVTSMGPISLASLTGKEFTSSRHPNLVDSWKLIAIRPDKAANQFSAGKVTEAQKPDAFVGSATLP